MYRRLTNTLEQWNNDNIQEPLLLTGARQVGKTWLINEFCTRSGRDYIYLNFEDQPDLSSIFDESLRPEDILLRLEAVLGRRIDPDRSIFFWDEVQLSERAITSLKYFCESDVNYRIICAGSLLGVKLSRFESSFPVGKVRILTLCPMDFAEFLGGIGEVALFEQIRDSFKSRKALPRILHEKALRYYHDYLFIGGMPRAVLDYAGNDKDPLKFDREIHRSLILAYMADMRKHTLSSAESVKIDAVYQSVPKQLAKENPKFMYSDIKHGANKRDFSSSLEWLKASSMIYQVNKVSFLQRPLNVYSEEGFFKIYMNDTGLLSSTVRMQYNDLLGDAHNIFKGAIAENYVAQTLSAYGIPLYYYKPSQNMEIDYLLESPDGIIPVEVKAGRHKRATSLDRYISEQDPPYAFRVSERGFGVSGSVYSIPFYYLPFVADTVYDTM